MRIILSILLVLLLVPDWATEPRLALYRGTPQVAVRSIALDPANPSRRRVGALEYLGGLQLRSSDPAFGGFSALVVQGDRFTTINDGSLIFGFRMGRDMRPHAFRFGVLPSGPFTGWAKIDRDSESLTLDPASGAMWVGFERANAIWRYAPDLKEAEDFVRPSQMRKWSRNSGPETLVRLRSGKFLVIPERERARALVYDGDPIDEANRYGFTFTYISPPEYRPTDAAELPDGRLVVLHRRVELGDWFSSKLALVDPRAMRRGAVVHGREIATLIAPLTHDNFEGIAATREGGDTILWLISDDNQSWFQRTLLLKFKLVEGAGKRPARASRRKAGR